MGIDRPLRLLYAGSLGTGTTCLDRMRALRDLGHETVPFDVSPFFRDAPRVLRSAAWRFQLGPVVRRINEALLTLGREASFDAVWIDKGNWIRPEVVAELKARSGMRLAVHVTPDTHFHENRSRLFFAGIGLYDLCATTKPHELALYARAGARDVILVLQGYGAGFDPALRGDPGASRFGHDILFVGHCQPHYARHLRVLAGLPCRRAIFGPRWPAYARRHPWAREIVQGEGVWGRDYAVALASSRIGIGLLSRGAADTTTTRSFEIPASGAMLLAERTPEHQALFEEGAEADFFSSPEELAEKAARYLRDEARRAEVAQNGWRRGLASQYDLTSQVRRVLDHLDR